MEIGKPQTCIVLGGEQLDEGVEDMLLPGYVVWLIYGGFP